MLSSQTQTRPQQQLQQQQHRQHLHHQQLSQRPADLSRLMIQPQSQQPLPAEVLLCPLCRCEIPAAASDLHIRSHASTRPHRCEHCRFGFRLRSSLDRHLRSRSHALRVEKGVESHAADIVAELGEAAKDEAEAPGTVMMTPHQQAMQPQRHPVFRPQQQPQHRHQQQQQLLRHPLQLQPTAAPLQQQQQRKDVGVVNLTQGGQVPNAVIPRDSRLPQLPLGLQPAMEHPLRAQRPQLRQDQLNLAAPNLLQSRPLEMTVIRQQQQQQQQHLPVPPHSLHGRVAQLHPPVLQSPRPDVQRVLVQQQPHPSKPSPSHLIAQRGLPTSSSPTFSTTLDTLKYTQPVLVQSRPQAAAPVPTPAMPHLDLRPRLPTAPLPLARPPVEAALKVHQGAPGSCPGAGFPQTVPTDLSAKKVGAETLQERIDKVISENQVRVRLLI